MGCTPSRSVDHVDAGHANYSITVKTGDHKGASTNSDIYVILVNEKGDRSHNIHLDNKWRDDFESGSTDTFPVSGLAADFGAITQLEISRKGRASDSWFCEWIKVDDNVNNKIFVFPIDRWMPKGFRMIIQEYDCSLPQFDKFPKQRRLELDEKKSTYAFAPTYSGLPCQVTDFPENEHFSNAYTFVIFKNAASGLVNGKLIALTSSRWESLDDLGNVYKSPYPVPTGMEHWKSDFEFGKQRLTGCNPHLIRLCTKIPENFAVTNEMLKPFLEEMTLEKAIERKLLFIIDLNVTKDIECTDPSQQICSPIALFFVNGDLDLVPIAIQLFQDKGDYNPVFLPSDDEYTWMFAKMWYNNADASYHQSASHLGMTHLLVESIAAATHCSLSPSHPLFRLLAPHFLYLIAINNLALGALINNDGWVDNVMAIGRIGMFDIIKRRFKTWRMDIDGTFPKELESRGVGDPDVLPKYHYREDAMLLWDAISKYVETVVNGHYDMPENISGDYELQAWHKSLSAPVDGGGCGIQGVPGDGCFRTKEEITQTVTSTIFTSSVTHAAVNFGQYDNYGFPPHYPASIDAKPPTTKDPRSEEDILNALPNKGKTISVMEVTKLLSMKATNGLGDFEVQYQFDPVGKKAVQQFREDLKTVTDTIKKRNNVRESPYTYLYPENVPNAISI